MAGRRADWLKWRHQLFSGQAPGLLWRRRSGLHQRRGRRRRLCSIRIHGQGSDKYENVRLGINGRLDTLQAAILLVKLKRFPEEIVARQKVAAMYTERLRNVVRTPVVPEGLVSAWAQYSIESEDRALCQKALQEAGVPTAIYYPIPIHLQKSMAGLGHAPGDFPVSERAADRIFSLPMHPYLEEKDIDLIAGVIRKTLA